MHNDPLLTQAEIDFIQSLSMQPTPRPTVPQTARLSIGEQLGELLERLGEDENLSLDTHSQGEHLSYPLRLIRTGHESPRLELGAPLILETGDIERPWRLRLPQALPLLDNRGQPNGLQVLELSSNGMLVRQQALSTPEPRLLGRLQLSEEVCVRIKGHWVRRVGRSRYAYHLQPLCTQDEEQLREFLFEHHRAGQLNETPA
ncbi:conserved hypothetical protein [Pseudomonas sp. 8Z]|uniref:hypothetical protein n=1 Tax=Pseudomonas sp. 8Z TaxID=2653166 RepID=UPI0012F37808|nr:hypothetical protein [Pseudomonas sp. 8Z]VXC75234.1 conserved hypothetical protein [Pseudomonas sp. 8Z]